MLLLQKQQQRSRDETPNHLHHRWQRQQRQQQTLAFQLLLVLSVTVTVALGWMQQQQQPLLIRPSSVTRSTIHLANEGRRSIQCRDLQPTRQCRQFAKNLMQQQQHQQRRYNNKAMMMMVDPNDLLQQLTTTPAVMDYHHHLMETVLSASVTDSEMATLWESLVSTMFSSSSKGAAALLQPAHGHSQPLFGPPDPYLTSGKSIAPSVQAMKEWMSLSSNTGVAAAGSTTLDATSSAATAAATVDPSSLLQQQQQSSAPYSERIQTAIQAATADGNKVLDMSKLGYNSVLPGFKQMGGILSRHEAEINIPNTEAAKSLVFRQFDHWDEMVTVMSKVPRAALFYVIVDFFFLRPAKDVYYKEDLEEDRVQTTMETLSLTTIRVGVFAVIALVTLALFGNGE